MARRIQFNISVKPETKEAIHKAAAELNMTASRFVETVFQVALSDSGQKAERILDSAFRAVLKEVVGRKKK